MAIDLQPIALAIASASAVAALICGAAQDLVHRTIPNSVSIIVALTSLVLLVGMPPMVAAGHIGLAVLVFVVGAFAFARRLVGGGDVKLLAAVTLWAGTALFSLLIVILALASVAIAVLMLAFDQLRPAAASGLGRASGWKAPLPLGVAIAVAGVLVIMHRAAVLPFN